MSDSDDPNEVPEMPHASDSSEPYRANFRMYEQHFPEIDELVMVQVRSIAEMGAYVSLLEYNNIEGMILLSELSRRRIRSINKLIRVGKQEICMVLRVDKEKGYIDLSKRRVSAEDVKMCEERFLRSKAIHSIVRHVATKEGMEIEEVYKQAAWPLYAKYGHASEAFRMAITEPDVIFSAENVPHLVPQLRTALLAEIAARLTPTAVKIRADIEVTCFQYEGIDAIKRALLKGVDLSTDELPVTIKLVAPPLYVMLCSCLDKVKGIALLNEAIEQMQAEIRAAKGELQVKAAPRAVDDRDDKLLSNLMSTLEAQNKEIDGDADAEEADEGMGSADVEGM